MAMRYGICTKGRTVWRVEAGIEPGHELKCAHCKRALPRPETFTRGDGNDPFAVVCRFCRPFEYDEILYQGRMVRCRGSGRLLVESWPEDPRGVQVVHPDYGAGFVEKAAMADLVWVRYWDKNRPGLLASRINAHLARVPNDVYRYNTVDQVIVDFVLHLIEKGAHVPDALLTALQVDRAYHIYINQGWRTGGVLGTIPSEFKAIIEYEMPNGSSALKIIDLVQDLDTYNGIVPYPWNSRGVSYFSLPKKWLRAVCEGSGEWWHGEPQQTRKTPRPPLETWAAKWPGEPLDI